MKQHVIHTKKNTKNIKKGAVKKMYFLHSPFFVFLLFKLNLTKNKKWECCGKWRGTLRHPVFP